MKLKVKQRPMEKCPWCLFFLKKGKSNCHKDGDWWPKQTPKVLHVIYQQETFFTSFKTAIILNATSTKALTLRSWLKSSKKLIFFPPTHKWREQTGHPHSAKYQWICVWKVFIHICCPSVASILFKSKNQWRPTANHTTATNLQSLVLQPISALNDLAFVFRRN